MYQYRVVKHVSKCFRIDAVDYGELAGLAAGKNRPPIVSDGEIKGHSTEKE